MRKQGKKKKKRISKRELKLKWEVSTRKSAILQKTKRNPSSSPLEQEMFTKKFSIFLKSVRGEGCTSLCIYKDAYVFISPSFLKYNIFL